MNTQSTAHVTITGPADMVALFVDAITKEQASTNDPAKIATLRTAMHAALSLCTVTVRNDTNAGDRWA
jgi:hypothetical protein